MMGSIQSILSQIINWARNSLELRLVNENRVENRVESLIENLVENRIVTKVMWDDNLNIAVFKNVAAREIVDIVLTNAGIVEESGESLFTLDRTIDEPSVSSFQTYCSKLEEVLGTPEPYQVSRRLERIEKYHVMDNMLIAMPSNAIYLLSMIETAAENAVINSKKPTNSSSKKSLLSDMTVLIITTSGDNVHFIVCQMSTFERIVDPNGLLWKNSKYEYVMDYKQKKFTLNKFKIQNIGEDILKSRQNVELIDVCIQE